MSLCNVKELIFRALPAFLVLIAGTAIAAANLPEGSALLPPDPLQAFSFGGAQYGSQKIVTVSGMPFTRAVRVSTDTVPSFSYNIQLVLPLTGPIAREDVILATFYLRSAESRDEAGEARTEMILEGKTEPRNGSSSGVLSVGTKWQQFQVPVLAKAAFKSGGAHLTFRMGFKRQQIELGGLTLVNYVKQVSIRDLPMTAVLSYPGREPEAPWRKAALVRIETIRKADLMVEVQDAKGKPLPGALVSVRMKRHAFGFGTAVNARYIVGTFAETEDGRKYRANLKEFFNLTVDEGEFKWPQWETKRDEAVKMFDWLRANGLPVRGHNLIWERPDRLPADIPGLKNDPAKLRQRINDHLREEVTFFKGKLIDWDVVNEPIPNHYLRDILGEAEMAQWYKLVRSIDPGVKLYVNDYQIEGTNPLKLDEFCRLLEYLEAQGAPVDGVGTQCHIGGSAPSPEAVLQSFDRLAKYVPEIKITEYDMDVLDERLQADFTRDMLIASFSHPAVNAFIIWGFWDGQHWKRNAPIFHKDWTLKPAGQVWLELIFNQWWTNAQGKTASDGRYLTRGFLGEYEISVTYAGKSSTLPLQLTKAGARITVCLD